MSCFSDGAFFFPLTSAEHEKSRLLPDKSKLRKKIMLPLTGQDQGNETEAREMIVLAGSHMSFPLRWAVNVCVSVLDFIVLFRG